jgi:ATP-dependent helicase/nuclease subunit B
VADRGPAVFTISVDRSFADALVSGIIAHHGKTPETLARGIVILPNARAIRAVTDAFVRRAEAGLLLPRLVPLGDVGEDGLGTLFDPAGAEAPPPAVTPMVRQFALARLVQQARAMIGRAVDMAEALRLAADLARVIDEMTGEDVPVSALATLDVGPALQSHWQKSLDLIAIIAADWPDELAQMGKIDLADRRGRLLAMRAADWAKSPPAPWVIAAGITTTVKPVAALLRVIARGGWGSVVLPGLDLESPDEEWDAVRGERIEGHPQYQLSLLLHRIDVARSDVRVWRWGDGKPPRPNRAVAVSTAFAPARFTDKWAGLKGMALPGVSLSEFATPAAEAQGIALALRAAIETPKRTAALVTPDRTLAGRVAAHLRRWGIVADDSAGMRLSVTPPGTLILGLARMAGERFAPVPLLSVLKHPLVRAGEHAGRGRLEWLDAVRALDRKLRGPRPAPGLASIATLLVPLDIEGILSPLEAMFAEKNPDPAILIDALRVAAEALAGDAIWTGPAGRAAGALFAELSQSLPLGPRDVRAEAIEPMLRQLMDDVVVRPPQGGHPRLFIWGLIEARLQAADLMILAGLNEGAWPAPAVPDPWLAPQVRNELSLSGPDRRVGVAAHDLASHLGGRAVMLTRSKRDARSPAAASRFLLRLDAMLGGVPRDQSWPLLAHAIDAGKGTPMRAARPAPKPPLSARPKRISVTAVDRLKADPYAFYAASILNLRPLEPVDADMAAAWRGQKVHDIFDDWFKLDRLDPAALKARIAALFADPATHPQMRALWAPRLNEALGWIASEVAKDEMAGRMPILSEEKGSIEIAGITLDGRADRVDTMPDGLAIVDYKTGKPPSPGQVEAGFALQLGLLSLIGEHGGFGGAPKKVVDAEYWSLAKDDGAFGARKKPWKKGGTLNADNFVAAAEAAFRKVAAQYLTGDAPFTAKLHPEWAPYTDYDQLMRREEWYGRE